MGLFEFHVALKKKIPSKTYIILKRIYRKTIKYPSEKRQLVKKLRKNCDIKFVKELLNKRIGFPHPYGIVISTGTKIGNDCTISQGVTIGAIKGLAPKIGDNVKIFANSVILGEINIGNNSVIGAGSIVTKNIPPNEVWAGNPAKHIRKVKDNEKFN